MEKWAIANKQRSQGKSKKIVNDSEKPLKSKFKE
jgi:hypothetical protein